MSVVHQKIILGWSTSLTKVGVVYMLESLSENAVKGVLHSLTKNYHVLCSTSKLSTPFWEINEYIL